MSTNHLSHIDNGTILPCMSPITFLSHNWEGIPEIGQPEVVIARPRIRQNLYPALRQPQIEQASRKYTKHGNPPFDRLDISQIVIFVIAAQGVRGRSWRWNYQRLGLLQKCTPTPGAYNQHLLYLDYSGRPRYYIQNYSSPITKKPIMLDDKKRFGARAHSIPMRKKESSHQV